MSYYPVLNAPGCTGWTTLCNYSPNNWEVGKPKTKYINLTWAENNIWRSEALGTLAPDEMRTVTINEVSGMVPPGALPFLSLTVKAFPARNETLPATDAERTHVPNWRATLGLSTRNGSTSYQGEIDPFPVPGSLLTFCPFLQFGNGVQNHLLLLNIERSAALRRAKVAIYDPANPDRPWGVFEAENNNVTVIGLDTLGFGPTQLPMVISKEICAIPLYLSLTRDGSCLSLEHTHPPASYVIHGKRGEVQKILKNIWFSRVTQ